MNYAENKNGTWELRHRPRWYEEDENGEPITITDSTLADHNIYPIQHNRPTFDNEAEIIKRDDQALWELIDGVVHIGYTVESLPPEEVRQNRKRGLKQERNRRMSLGFDHDFGDERGIHTIGTTEEDMSGWDDVTKWAQSKLALNKTSDTKIISTETGYTPVTPLEWFDIVESADSFRGPIWQAYFNLKDMDPIPSDYTADSYWT